MNDMMGRWIMGITGNGPVAGKVIHVTQPQYPGQEVSYRVSWIEGYEGRLEEGNFAYFDQDKFNYIIKKWNEILIAKEDILNTLRML